jgi:hypothetical protein
VCVCVCVCACACNTYPRAPESIHRHQSPRRPRISSQSESEENTMRHSDNTKMPPARTANQKCKGREKFNGDGKRMRKYKTKRTWMTSFAIFTNPAALIEEKLNQSTERERDNVLTAVRPRGSRCHHSHMQSKNGPTKSKKNRTERERKREKS